MEDTHKPVGKDKHPAFHGQFSKICYDDGQVTCPFINGSFSKNGSEKHTLYWNPKNALEHPLFTHFYNNSLPKNLRTEASFSVQLGIKPPKNHPLSFPFVKKIETVVEDEVVTVEPLDGVPPPEFLKDVAENPLFNIHIVLGLPDNDVVPTLSFQDVVRLSPTKPGTWPAVERAVHLKDKNLASHPDNK